MNKVLSLMAVSMLAMPAYAARSTTSATVAPNANAAMSASAIAPSSAATVSVAAAAVDAKPKKVTVSLVAENEIGMAEANHGAWEGQASSTQHLGLAYDLGNSRKVQYRQYFYYNSTDAVRTDEYALGEHMFRYIDGKSMTIGAATVATDFRVYLPGSRYVSAVGQYQFRIDNAIEQAFGKMTVAYGLSTRAYAYSQNSAGQMSFRLMPSVGVEYKANKVLTPHATIFTDDRWYNTGRGIATLGPKAGRTGDPADNRDSLYTDMGVAAAINKNINLDFYVETAKDLRSNANYYLLDDKTSSYMLDLSVSL